MKTLKNRLWLAALISLLTICALTAFGVWAESNQAPAPANAPAAQQQVPSSAETETAPADDTYQLNFVEGLAKIWDSTGFAHGDWRQYVMIAVSFVLIYLAVVKGFEPLLLLPIAFGMLLANLPIAGMMDEGGLLYYLYKGVKLGIYPPLIFMGVGAMTDFAPLIANPKSLLLGAAAQLGIFITFIGALLLGFKPAEAGSIGIIGGADGPTAIFTTTQLAPHLLGPIAVAAYSYMALVPVIQPPIMKALTTHEERMIVMDQLRPVSKAELVIFPILVTLVVSLMLPPAAPLVGMLMLGNLFRVSGVTERLSKTAQNELINIVTIFLGTTVGATTNGATFLAPQTLYIIVLGVIAFGGGTAGGVLLGKLMCKLSGGKINPLIGSAGVSAVPMAARVSQVVAQQENPGNFLLMHAMGPNVAGVIGSAVAAGVFLSLLK
ncbi:sodium ion-translocating decarboxylase subunit beta [Bacillota bacterium Meth-B3]|nr:sodium ion-translocating decarboxylase subunit beta [Christensenellaceae bacterium]MEA5069970.1 sodium ion-translocating decarboxylase subunit beta [Christensenellaceae bacterium]